MQESFSSTHDRDPKEDTHEMILQQLQGMSLEAASELIQKKFPERPDAVLTVLKEVFPETDENILKSVAGYH